MEITSETYRAIGGHMVTRHILSFGRGAAHSLNTRQLWQLCMLAVVELEKYLAEPEETLEGARLEALREVAAQLDEEIPGILDAFDSTEKIPVKAILRWAAEDAERNQEK